MAKDDGKKYFEVDLPLSLHSKIREAVVRDGNRFTLADGTEAILSVARDQLVRAVVDGREKLFSVIDEPRIKLQVRVALPLRERIIEAAKKTFSTRTGCGVLALLGLQDQFSELLKKG